MVVKNMFMSVIVIGQSQHMETLNQFPAANIIARLAVFIM